MSHTTKGVEQSERGYAMVAAVAGIALMATIAASLVNLANSRIDTLQAEATRAQLVSAADAGIVLALAGMTDDGTIYRWTLNGETHTARIDGVSLNIHLEDEHGKFNLGLADDENLAGLLTVLGYGGAQLDQLRASYLRWTGETDDTPEANAEYAYYEAHGLIPRNMPPLTIDELGEIPGFTPKLVRRLHEVVTVDIGKVPFDIQHAGPLALQAMSASGIDTPQLIERRRELAGQNTALSFSSKAMKMRTISAVVVASTPDGSTVTRRAVALISGSPHAPWTIHYIE